MSPSIAGSLRQPQGRRWRRLTVVVILAAAGCTNSSDRNGPPPAPPTSIGAEIVAPQQTAALPRHARPWFAASDAFWEPVPADAETSATDADVHRLLTEPTGNKVANLSSFAAPITHWDPSEPAIALTVSQLGDDAWGNNSLADVKALQIPSDVTPAPGSDGKLIVVDRARNRVIDLLAVTKTDQGWTAMWGGVYPLDGDGTSDAPAYQGPNGRPYPEPLSRGTGSGISSLAGLVTLDDIRSGSIQHALVFATDRACGPPFVGPFFFPATTTDGWVQDAPCIPEGGRLQINPSVDLHQLELEPGELMIAQALQTFGAYCIDNGGSRVGFIFELPRDANGVAEYASVGLTGDYASLNDLPWESVRLLKPIDP